MGEKGLADFEELILRIHDKSIIPLVREAIDCYNVGAYRAAINTIWNVLIYDVYKKTKYLAENFEHAEAKKITYKIENQINNGNYIKEWNLIKDYLFERFKALDEIELDKLDIIKKYRNLSSHLSIYIKNGELIQPTAEETRMCIRIAIDIVLSRPPILGKSTIDYLMNDIKGTYFPENYNTFENIIKEKYLNKGDKYFIRNLLIRTLKEYFYEDEYLNQLKNLIIVLYKNFRIYFEDDVIKNIFSKIENSQIIKISELLIMKPKIIEVISSDTKLRLKEYIYRNLIISNKSNKYLNQEIFLLKLNLYKNLEISENEIMEDFKKYIYYIDTNKIAKNEFIPIAIKRRFLNICIEKIKEIDNFKESDNFIQYILSPLLSFMETKEELNNLLQNVLDNKSSNGINQIIGSFNFPNNLKIIFENIPPKVVKEGYNYLEKFLKYLEENYFYEEEDLEELKKILNKS